MHPKLTDIDRLIPIYRDGLLNDVLPFWLKHAIDREHGGFMCSLDRDGSLLDTDKGVWQQGRFTWLLGELHNNLPELAKQNSDWLDLAENGIRFLEKNCFDSTDGRMWFHVTREGLPIRKRRYAFTESFAAIAFGEVAEATANDELAERATKLFWQFAVRCMNMPETEQKFTGVRPSKSIGFPMIAIVSAQQLRGSIQMEHADRAIDDCVTLIRDHHMKPDIECLMETVGPNGELINHFDGRLLNPGHAIECAWFMMAEGEYRNDASLIDDGCRILDWMWKRGWDQEFGGILYFVDVDNRPVQEYWHDMKFWWPQCETLIATLLAYKLTRNEKYWSMFTQIHDWTHQHFPDPDCGEWFGYLHRDMRVSVPLKGNLWKGPFHIPRMQLVCWQVLEELRKS